MCILPIKILILLCTFNNIIIIIGLAIRNELRATIDCFCLGQDATYECTVIGGDFTLWNGSIMDPPGCKISLPHRQFFNVNDTSCNDGTVVAKGLTITNGSCYTSLLTVLVTQEMNGGSVSCVVDKNLEESLIDTTIINITTGIII